MNLYGGHEDLEGKELLQVIVALPSFVRWEVEVAYRAHDVYMSLDEAPVSNTYIEQA